MKPKVYVEGQAGTTGLQIVERLKNRDDLILLTIDEDKRHDDAARAAMMNEADLVFLCLPDQAAIDAVKLVSNPNTKIIDASTAHRTTWTYGFSDLSKESKEEIKKATRVANPGCHATGLIAGLYPLIQGGLLDPNIPVHAFSLTGYSGGGKKMIAQYENEKTQDLLAPRLYGLNMAHKHLPEMKKITGLQSNVLFTPIVDDYYKGMAVSISLDASSFLKKVSLSELRDFYQDWFKESKLVEVADHASQGMISANTMAGKDSLQIWINGNDEQILVTALFDNLGKGASGAAVQNMNLMLGLDELSGLFL
jgi:N-acetyl-gamma-glutamyl-phosphate reductase